MFKKRKHTDAEHESLGERIHDRVVAAEVAAEEAAGYGWATEAVEAAEAAVDPGRELGEEEPPPPA